MEPLTPRQRGRLVANHHLQRTLGRFDHLVDLHPVLQLTVPRAKGFWLVTELDPDDPDFFFGLCAPGHLTPYVGYGRFSRVEVLAAEFGTYVERHSLSIGGASLSVRLEQSLAQYEQHRAAGLAIQGPQC